MSGRVADRPGLQKALDILRKGDTFGVCKLDRLGRSVKQLVDLVSGFEDESINFVSLTDSIRALLQDASSSTSWRASPRWSGS